MRKEPRPPAALTSKAFESLPKALKAFRLAGEKEFPPRELPCRNNFLVPKAALGIPDAGDYPRTRFPNWNSYLGTTAPDIFISFAREDEAWVGQLAAALEFNWALRFLGPAHSRRQELAVIYRRGFGAGTLRCGRLVRALCQVQLRPSRSGRRNGARVARTGAPPTLAATIGIPGDPCSRSLRLDAGDLRARIRLVPPGSSQTLG